MDPCTKQGGNKGAVQYVKYFRDCILWALLCVVRVPSALHIEISVKLQLEFICGLCSRAPKLCHNLVITSFQEVFS